MQELRFYHLSRTSIPLALPQLLHKSLERGKRSLVFTASEAESEALADHLWRYDEASFLPHGTAKDGDSAAQPIFLTAQAENPNGATILFSTTPVFPPFFRDFPLVALLFEDRDAAGLAAARALWKDMKGQAEITTSYWREDEAGRWAQKG